MARISTSIKQIVTILGLMAIQFTAIANEVQSIREIQVSFSSLIPQNVSACSLSRLDYADYDKSRNRVTRKKFRVECDGELIIDTLAEFPTGLSPIGSLTAFSPIMTSRGLRLINISSAGDYSLFYGR